MFLKIHTKFLIAILTFAFFAFGAFWFYFYSGKILPGVYLANVNYSGFSKSDAQKLVKDQFSSFSEASVDISLKDGDTSSLAVTPAELGVEFNASETVDQLYKVGRSQGLAGYFVYCFKSSFVRQTVAPSYQVNANKFEQTTNSLFSGKQIEPINANVAFKNNAFTVVPETPGRSYNREFLISQIKRNITALETDIINVELEDVPAAIASENAKNALLKLQTLQKQKISLVFGGDSWSLSGNNLISILEFSSGRDDLVYDFGNNSFVLKSIAAKDEDAPVLDVTLNSLALEKFINNIGNSIDVSTVDAGFVFEGEKISQFTPARDGKQLNREKLKELILSKVSVENTSGEGELVINLPVSVTKAKLENEQINSMGISEVLAKGASYFGGSIPNRIYNLTLGAKRINGTLVKPGETFSFNHAVGEVSGATGYKPAYVISSGRTVLDDGGGICQVSTTVFRAALNAGLPIVSRTAHAYRVGYYEQHGFKPGLDATVWSPAVDLSFKNDTDHHLLVQAVVDNANAKLEVTIYGTKDGRKVELSDPVVSNIKPAPEPRYQDDPTLPKGTTKQVDFAAGGATSVFTRKVYRGNDLVIDDVFKSVYRPWQAVYLVGTGG